MIRISRFLLLALLLVPLAAAAAGEICTPDDAFWLTPRSGAAIQSDANIAPCIRALLDQPGTWLAITYPDNDEASVRADELRQWLLALALPAARVRLEKNPSNTTIELEIRND